MQPSTRMAAQFHEVLKYPDPFHLYTAPILGRVVQGGICFLGSRLEEETEKEGRAHSGHVLRMIPRCCHRILPLFLTSKPELNHILIPM